MIFFNDKLAKQFRGFCNTNQIFIDSPIDGVNLFPWDTDLSKEMTLDGADISDALMLGKRAERFFSEWIEINGEYEILKEGIQIFYGKETLGEFDFLLKELATNRIIHLEMVYKFYLFDKNYR